MEQKNKALEKRKYIRIPLDAYVVADLDVNKTLQERLYMTKDISLGGLFLICNESFPVGTILNIKLHTPISSEPVLAEAEVVRIAKDENLHTIGMGLVFTRINAGNKNKKELAKHLYLAYHYLNKRPSQEK